MYKIKFILNENEELYKKFIKNMDSLYDKISYIIEDNYDIKISHIIRPIYGKGNIKFFYTKLTNNTYIENIINNEKLKINDINYKMFDLYAILYNPILNINDENIYINFGIHSLLVKILENKNKNIDYKKIKNIMKI